MTLPSLLRHVGVHIPRGVTVDGRVLTGHAAVAAVAAHTATAVAPHTFHSGEDPPRSPATRPAWWDDPAARAADVAAVHAAFPGFRLDDSDGGYAWHGVLDTGRGRFAITVVGSPERGLPQLVPVRPKALGRSEGSRGFRKSEHLYTSGNLCVAALEDWDAQHHTTDTAIAWAAHWFAAYTDWRMSGGSWPIDGYHPHAA